MMRFSEAKQSERIPIPAGDLISIEKSVSMFDMKALRGWYLAYPTAFYSDQAGGGGFDSPSPRQPC